MSRPAEKTRAQTREQAHDQAHDGGFSLVEVVVSVGILVLLITFVLPALLVGIKADAVAQRTTQARNLAQAQMERLRNLPFHVAYDVGSEYVDLLDRYYEDLDAPTTTVVCGPSGDRTVPTTGWTGYVTGAATRCSWEPATGPFFRQVQVGSGDGAGFVTVTTTQLLSDASPPQVVTPPADWDSQRSGRDSPPASQVGVTVTVFSSLAGDREPVSTSSQLTRQSLATPRVEASVQVAALQLGTNVAATDPALADPVAVPVTLSAGLVDLAGSVTATSRTDAVLGSTLTGLGTGAQARGASASGAAPGDQSVVSAGSLAGQLDASGCQLVCWGGTRTTAFAVRASNGLPVVADPAAPATATVTDLSSGGVSLAGGADADYRERLSLAGPLVRLADGATPVKSGISSSCQVAETGESVRVVAGGWLRTADRVPSSAALQVDACGAARASALAVLPTTFAPEGVLQVRLVRAAARCTVSGGAHTATTAVDYEAVVRRWTGASPDPYTTVATVRPDATTDPLAGLDLDTLPVPGHGVLGDYIASWTSLTRDRVVRTAGAGSATVDVPALVSVVTQPVRTGTEPLTTSSPSPAPSPTPSPSPTPTAEPGADPTASPSSPTPTAEPTPTPPPAPDLVDPASSVSVSVGALSCSALDAR